MPDLSTRSYQKELLDSDYIPFADIKQNLKELNTVNKLLGGHEISVRGLKEIIGKNYKNKTITICEIGCGGGDNLQALWKYCEKKGIHAKFIGIDLKQACVEYAKEQYPELPAKWITNDYAKVEFGSVKPTIIFSSLFCHHFTESELTFMLQWMNYNSIQGFFINDLERNPLAYFLIKWITHFFSSSYLVKNDAALSVARGFKKREWEDLLQAAAIKYYYIRWKWAFRYLIVCKHGA